MFFLPYSFGSSCVCHVNECITCSHLSPRTTIAKGVPPDYFDQNNKTKIRVGQNNESPDPLAIKKLF